MNRLDLAQLVDWAGELKTRKMLQKVVYLLSVAGWPVDVKYTLHLYGPYSHDVAQLADEMVRAGLLEETEYPKAMGKSFSYRISETARGELSAYNSAQKPNHEAENLKCLAQKLFNEPLALLELSSTLVFFWKQYNNWDLARAATAKFKTQTLHNSAMINAEKLAKEILQQPGQ